MKINFSSEKLLFKKQRQQQQPHLKKKNKIEVLTNTLRDNIHLLKSKCRTASEKLFHFIWNTCFAYSTLFNAVQRGISRAVERELCTRTIYSTTKKNIRNIHSLTRQTIWYHIYMYLYVYNIFCTN